MSLNNKMKKPKFYRLKSELPRGTTCIDALTGSIRELFFIEHPHVHKDDPRAEELFRVFRSTVSVRDTWVYYPWHSIAVHIPSEDVYYRLRTARNRNLISNEEQQVYRSAVVGVAGLSVGSAVVASLTATGGPKHMKLADPDIIEITNLNRMRATLTDVGSNKAETLARKVWEVDPFADIEVWNKGIQRNDLTDFLFKKPAIDIFVDEMDDIAMKVAARFACRAAKIPVVMATDNGDSIIVDIERFDKEPKRPIFHGRVKLTQSQVANMNRSKFIALSTKIIDPTYFTGKQQQSILAIGKELSGIAQIGTAATIAGAALAFVVRRIANGDEMPSGRYVMGCEPTFIPNYNSASEKKKRKRDTANFLKAMTSPKKSAK